MTTREFLSTVIELSVDPDLTAKAQELMTALDVKNAKRKSTESKEKKEASARRDAVLAFLTTNEGAFTRDAIAVACEMTIGQAQSAALALVRLGLVNKSEIKVDKTKRTVYEAA